MAARPLLYYADRYADRAEQFAADVAVNPNDTEEQIWHLLCLAQIKGGLAAARPFKLTVGTDRRPVMRAVQKLFLSGTDDAEAELAALARGGDTGSRFYARSLFEPLSRELGRQGEGREPDARGREDSYALGQAHATGWSSSRTHNAAARVETMRPRARSAVREKCLKKLHLSLAESAPLASKHATAPAGAARALRHLSIDADTRR